MMKKRNFAFTRGQWIGLVSGLFFFFVFYFNVFGLSLPEPALKVAGVVLLMAAFWISLCLPIAVTSLLPIALFPLLGIATSGQTVKFYSNNNIYLFMGGFIIALAIEKWDLHKRLALWVTVAIGTSPKMTVLGFMVATAVLSMWISNTATTMMMLPIAMAVIAGIGKENKGFATALMLGIAYSASVGGIATPIGTPPNIEFLGQYERAFPDADPITFFMWFKGFLPLTCILLPIIWAVVMMRNGGFKHQKKESTDTVKKALKALGHMTSAEKRVLIVFGLTALLWMFRSNINLGAFTLPGWSSLFDDPRYIHDATVAIVMAVLLFIIPAGKKEPGQMLMDWDTAVKLPWGILLLFGGGFAVAGGFSLSGLDIALGELLKPYLTFHPLFIVLTVCVLITFLTELTSNTATTAALLPVMKGTAIALNLDPLLLMIPTTISASMAFMLPVATPPNAIVFSSGKITMGEMVRTGVLLNLLISVIVSFYVYFIVLPSWTG